ncbi:EpsG family protein [Enterococcus massiliensis]|uniref:EpsG family protein n=1 Tax=Enterococcus massiliensis TaxID=1640685 RepID=UPI00065E34CB|nr:EpsG family protein [Enterococcus massiliensis]
MWLFFALTIYLLLLKAFFEKREKAYLFFSFVAFFSLSAFRSINVGNDTLDYKLLFESLKTVPVSNFTWRYESGYLYFNKFIQFFSDNSQALFIVSAAIICLGYALFINKFSDTVWVSVYLFFMLRYFDLSMNVLRQSLAMVILFFGFNLLIKEKKIRYFVLTVLLASLFHKTALIFLVLIFLNKIKFRKRYVLFLFSSTVLGLLFFNPIFNTVLKIFPTYTYYINSSYMDGTARLATFFNIAVNLVILLFLYINKFENNRINNLMFNTFIFGLAITVISLRFSLLDRVGDFFTIYAIILIPNSLDYMKRFKQSKLFWTYILLICFFIYYLVIVVYRPDWNRVYPYEFFWSLN